MKRKAKRRSISNQVSAKEIKNISQNIKGFGYVMPPDFDIVNIYFDQKGRLEIACTFFLHFQKSNWKTDSGYPVRNWKVVATDWIFEHEQSLKLFERRTANNLK